MTPMPCVMAFEVAARRAVWPSDEVATASELARLEKRPKFVPAPYPRRTLVARSSGSRSLPKLAEAATAGRLDERADLEIDLSPREYL